MAAVIAYRRDAGITSEDRQRIIADARAICASGKLPSLTLMGTPYGLGCGTSDPLDLSPGPSLLISSDNTVVLASALMTDDSTQTAEAAVEAIREIVPPPEGDETGLRAYVTGEAGFEADRSAAVKGIDETLLLVTCTVLILLLLAIYRSPLVAVVPILVVGIAYIVAVEGVLANLDFVGRALTVVYYVRALVLRWLDLPRDQLRRCQETWGMTDLEKLPPPGECALTLLGFGAAVAVLSAVWFARSEFRVKTPEGS